MSQQVDSLAETAKRIRRLILETAALAGSGHPTSSLSAVELIVGLVFGGTFHYDIDDPELSTNDRLIFSKGHATPLLYAMWTIAGVLSEDDLKGYRQFGNMLEGHPSMAFPYVNAATGSLGQGLSIGLGVALNARHLDQLPGRTYVLLGDSEMAEGQHWEAIQFAAHYQLGNLIGLLDVNRLGQRGETMYGHDLEAYERRVQAFGWETRLIDGHSLPEVKDACEWAAADADQPRMIIAKTIKGRGVSFLEDADGWHGKAVENDQLRQALDEIGPADDRPTLDIPKPSPHASSVPKPAATVPDPDYSPDDSVPTRNAFGNALKRIQPKFPDLVSLDAEVCNSTRAEYFRDAHPERFFEMYVAEQNMVGTAIGLSRMGKIPFVSTFAAFLTRAFDQIRMARYSEANIKFVGSHAGVSIGQDGPSQMGLEDIAMFRTILDGVVLYPCDAVSTEKLVEAMAAHTGIAYLRTTRGPTPVIYGAEEKFPIGGCKILRQTSRDEYAIVAAGITVREALVAHEALKCEGIRTRVIDLYSVKPIDSATLHATARPCKGIVTVEDHYAEGGIGEAVAAALADCPTPVVSLAVRSKPCSGDPYELLAYQGITAADIFTTVKSCC